MTTVGHLPLTLSTQHDSTVYQRMVEESVVPMWLVELTDVYALFADRQFTEAQQLHAGFTADELARSVRILAANKAALDLLGAPSLEALNTALVDPSYEWLVLQVVSLVEAIAQGEKQLALVESVGESTVQQADVWFNFSLPASDTERKIASVCALDVTALQETQAEFSAQKEFLAGVINAVPDLLFVFDFETLNVSFANQDIARLLGFDFDVSELNSTELACFWEQLVHPEDQTQLAQLDGLLQELSENTFTERQLRFKDVHGNWRYFYARSASLQLDDVSAPRYAVVVARDISTDMAARFRLQEQERHYRLLADNFSDVICACDLDRNLTYVSPSISAAIGLSVDDFMSLSKESNLRAEVVGFIDELGKDIESIKMADLEQTKNYKQVVEISIPHVDGRLIPFEVQCSLLHEHDAPQGILFLARDLTERKKIDADLRMAAKVFENNADGIYILDPEGVIVQLNNALCRICNFEEQHLLGRKPEGLLVPEGENDTLRQQNVQHALIHGYWQGEQLALRSTGEVFHAFSTTTVVRSSDNDILAYICTLRDITESKNHEERIRHLAFYDALTELPNRTLFQDRLEHELQRCERGQQTAALLFLDLDHFKAINDSLGHAAGDQLLREVAERLGENVRSEDTIARMGGDEFTIILSGQASKEHVVAAASNVARKIAAQLSEPFLIEGQEVFTSASIGVALYPDDGEDPSTLLRAGDTAMYFAKQAGKNNYQFYSSSMNAHSAEQLAFQNSLYRAASDQEFELYYQPQFSYLSHKVVGVECLLRWRKPDGSLLAPDQFIQLAEQSGLIVRIGEWVMRRACEQMAEWLATGLTLDHVAINISARQFKDDNLLSTIESVLRDTGLPARCVELELTESVLMSEISYTLQTLAKLKELGLRIAIDDFGTGYSSLNYLKELPVDTIKIDKRFVQNLPGSKEDQQIINVIVALARGFDLDMVAEGVETDEQSSYLEGLGCEVAQGYLFAHPQQPYDLEQLIRGGDQSSSETNT
ncbi:MAG: sensor domain-containing protein [Pseudomonadales bacterium]